MYEDSEMYRRTVGYRERLWSNSYDYSRYEFFDLSEETRISFIKFVVCFQTEP